MASSPAGKLFGWLLTAAIAVAAIILVASLVHKGSTTQPLPTRVQCTPANVPLAKSYCQVVSKDGVWVINVKGGYLISTRISGGS